MPLQKLCNRCKQDKPAGEFYANKRMKDGLNTFCIECHKADNVARKIINRADPVFLVQERKQAKKNRSPKQNQYNELTKIWREKNQVHVKNYSKQYRDSHKDYFSFACQKRKITLLNRTPSWLTEDELWIIKEAYSLSALRTKMLGFSWHVDHIIPLRGKNVSGLHVPENLQVIPAIYNLRKTNKYEGVTC